MAPSRSPSNRAAGGCSGPRPLPAGADKLTLSPHRSLDSRCEGDCGVCDLAWDRSYLRDLPTGARRRRFSSSIRTVTRSSSSVDWRSNAQAHGQEKAMLVYRLLHAGLIVHNDRLGAGSIGTRSAFGIAGAGAEPGRTEYHAVGGRPGPGRHRVPVSVHVEPGPAPDRRGRQEFFITSSVSCRNAGGLGNCA